MHRPKWCEVYTQTRNGTDTVYGKRSFLSKESDTLKILQSIYFANDVGIISSYSNRILTFRFVSLTKQQRF